MKSSFLLTCILSFLVSLSVWGQAAKKTDSSKTATEAKKSSFDKFYDRMKIVYFGAYSGSSLDHWDNFTLTEQAEKDFTLTPNIWNQLAIRYNFGAKMDFVIAPRWTILLQPTDKQDPGTRGIFQIEDALVGFQGVWITGEDKKFNLFTRAGARLPTSRASRDGDVTLQPEIFNGYTYDFNKEWQLGLYQQFRHWVYEQKYTAYRYRIYHSPYVQYSVSDTDRLVLYYELYLENRKNLKSQNGKNPNLKKSWENAMLAWSHDVTPKLNLMPFLGYIIDAKDISTYPGRPTWFGAWISYSFK